MSKREYVPESAERRPTLPSRLGLVVHPTRDIDEVLSDLRRWAEANQAQLVQIRAAYEQQQVAEQGRAEECDLIVAIGGDGTTLAAIRAGVAARRPVLPVACGSLGILTSLAAPETVEALERFGRDDWVPRRLPALDITREPESPLVAFNDVAIVRDGVGQVRVTAEVDGQLFARIAGDGCIVSTPLGSSAYALAAGGPLLDPDLDALLITPLTIHGGSCPPFVAAAGSVIRLDATTGYGGARLELDGQVADKVRAPVTIRLRPGVATLVGFSDQQPVLATLRQRGIITDSPRILAEEAHHEFPPPDALR
jgi:NAD+ kinase